MARGAAARQIVLDTNVVGAYLFKEESTPTARLVMDRVDGGDLIAFVPSLFWAELQHVCFQKTVRSTRNPTPVAVDEARHAYELARELDLVELSEQSERQGELAFHRDDAWELILAYGLGSYDAYFLAFAKHLDLEVWTFDAKFRHAVRTAPKPGPEAALVCLIGTDVQA